MGTRQVCRSLETEDLEIARGKVRQIESAQGCEVDFIIGDHTVVKSNYEHFQTFTRDFDLVK